MVMFSTILQYHIYMYNKEKNTCIKDALMKSESELPFSIFKSTRVSSSTKHLNRR